jgi:hypothetical protein
VSNRTERLLWLLVSVSLVGDVLTTVYGLSAGLSEANPVAARLFEAHGIVVGILSLKLGALAVGTIAWRIYPERYRWLAPASLAVPWTAVVWVNIVGIGMTVLW